METSGGEPGGLADALLLAFGEAGAGLLVG